MVCKKAFKNKLLICLLGFIMFFSVPMTAKASTYPLELYPSSFETDEVYITNSAVSCELYDYFSFLVSLDQGYYRLIINYDYTQYYASSVGSNEPSYVWDFFIQIGNELYEPCYKSNGTVSFDIIFHAQDSLGGFSLIAKCKWWTTPNADGQMNFGRFYATTDPVYSYLSDISFEEYAQLVVDKQGNAFLEEGNKLQEEANTMQSEEISLQEEANTMQSQEIELQEEANELQEEANRTGKSLLDKVTDFFDNFFSRLGDFLLGLIVPSVEELTVFLDEVNDWFGERLGFIWYPFSFAVDMVSALANGTADTGFQVPEFRLNILGTEYQIWGGMTVDLDAFGIFKYVRIFTSFLLVGGIVKLAYDKWDEWIGGHGVG